MRVLLSALSCNPAVGSEALVGYKYVEALSRRFQAVLFASPPTETPDGVELKVCDAGPCTFNEVAALPLLRFEWNQLRLARKLKSTFDFDLVHRITPGSINIPSWIFRLRKPVVIGPIIAADRPPRAFEQFLNRPATPPSHPRWHPKRIAKRLCREFVKNAGRRAGHLHRAACILVGTRTAQRALPDDCRGKSRLITYSGVEHEVFVPGENINSQDVLRLLYVGRFVPYKGIELLIQAFARASKSRRMHLTLVGDGDPLFTTYITRVLSDRGISLQTFDRPPEQGSVIAPSRATMVRGASRSQLPSFYQQADVFCFPTLCDTYGIALLEAMSCGCPVLVSDVAGAGEIVNGDNGLKVPLQNPEQYIAALSEAILGLAKNPERRAALGAAARQYILREHDWPRITNDLLRCYDDLLTNGVIGKRA